MLIKGWMWPIYFLEKLVSLEIFYFSLLSVINYDNNNCKNIRFTIIHLKIIVLIIFDISFWLDGPKENYLHLSQIICEVANNCYESTWFFQSIHIRKLIAQLNCFKIKSELNQNFNDFHPWKITAKTRKKQFSPNQMQKWVSPFCRSCFQ